MHALRSDYNTYEDLLRREAIEEQIARKQKRKCSQLITAAIREFDWPAHVRIGAQVREEILAREARDKARDLAARRRSLLRDLLEVAALMRANSDTSDTAPCVDVSVNAP